MSGHLVQPQGSRDVTVSRGANARLEHGALRFTDLGGASHGVALLGHNHPRVVQAIQDQLPELLHVPIGIENPVRDRFLELLHGHLPTSLERTFLCNSGTEAVEAALKMAMAATGRTGMVAAKGCFHGRTLGAVSLMDRAPYRAAFEGRLAATTHVPYDDPEPLHEAITSDTAAVVLEPIQGEGGVRPASEAFLRAARDLSEDRGALLVLDEVQTGAGRTGTFLAAQGVAIEPDIVTLGKGLAGGLPVGAAVATAAVADALPRGSHGSTYGGSPLVAAAGCAVMDVLREEALPGRARRLGIHVMGTVRSWDLPIVREVRGRGLMLGIDLRTRSAAAVRVLQERGVLALGAGPTVLRLLPPLTIEEEVLDDALDRIRDVLAGPDAA